MRLSFQEKLSLNITIVKQENSYYPYGLIMPNSTIATPSQPNRNLYNGGSEWQNDYGDLPDLYQTFYRSYDAALGRFTGIDPMAEKFNSLSPYHYAGNNPIMNNDPLGDDFTQQDWDNAMHALRYSRDGASIGEGGFIRYYTSAKDAHYTAAAAIDRSGGWGYTGYGSFRNFSDNMVYNYGRSFYGDWSNLRYGGNYGDVSGIPLKQVNIVKYKPLWIVEEEERKAKQGGNHWLKTTSDVFSAAGLGANTKEELLEWSVRSSYRSNSTREGWNALRATQKAWRTTNTLGKTGAKYLKYVKGLGVAGEVVGVASAGYQLIENPTAGNATRLAVQGIAIGSAFIPGVGWAISIGLGTADAIWGDDFYNWIDKH